MKEVPASPGNTVLGCIAHESDDSCSKGSMRAHLPAHSSQQQLPRTCSVTMSIVYHCLRIMGGGLCHRDAIQPSFRRSPASRDSGMGTVNHARRKLTIPIFRVLELLRIRHQRIDLLPRQEDRRHRPYGPATHLHTVALPCGRPE